MLHPGKRFGWELVWKRRASDPTLGRVRWERDDELARAGKGGGKRATHVTGSSISSSDGSASTGVDPHMPIADNIDSLVPSLLRPIGRGDSNQLLMISKRWWFEENQTG